MNRFILISIIAIAIFSMDLYASNQIIVQYGDSARIYDATQFQTAINEAVAGSDIYLPGGYNFTLDYIISKRVNIYGAGGFDKSSSLTGVTWINNLYYLTGSDGSIIEGVNTRIRIGQNTNKVSNITINKCKIGFMYIASHDSTKNIIFKDCVIIGNYDNQIFPKNISTKFYNCIFDRLPNHTHNLYQSFRANFYNCVFYVIPNISCLIFSITTSSNNYFENCIFKSDNIALSNLGRLNVFTNCLITANQTNWGSENLAENCIINENKDSVFTYTVNNSNYYSEQNDYHLKDSCKGKNYGIDGTDLGIYGTAFPFKENSVPIIPYIKAYSTATRTENGKLEISVDVESQTK